MRIITFPRYLVYTACNLCPMGVVTFSYVFYIQNVTNFMGQAQHQAKSVKKKKKKFLYKNLFSHIFNENPCIINWMGLEISCAFLVLRCQRKLLPVLFSVLTRVQRGGSTKYNKKKKNCCGYKKWMLLVPKKRSNETEIAPPHLLDMRV